MTTFNKLITIDGKMPQVLSLISSMLERKDSDFQQFDPQFKITKITGIMTAGEYTTSVYATSSEDIYPESVAEMAGDRYGVEVSIAND